MSADSVAQEQLISFVRRIESLEDEAKAIGDDKSAVYKEARGNGFDTKTIRKVIAKRRLGAAERDEQDALFQLYWDAIHGVARAHVEIIEEISPHDEDGVILETSSQADGGVVSDVGPVPASAGQVSDEDRQPIRRMSMTPLEPREAGGLKGFGFTVRFDETPDVGSDADEQASGIGTCMEADPAHDASAATPSAETDRSGEAASSLSSPAPVTNILPMRTHNPETHFLNSKGLVRLHGCKNPETCGSAQPRSKLCFTCSVQHDGPTHSGEVA